MDLRESRWIRGGRVEEVAWVDRDVIAWCSGVHVAFFDLKEHRETAYRCPESIDGACCIAGKPSMRLFTFAEVCNNPRLLIYSYPTMKLVNECSNGSENGYLSTAFACSEFIVTLGSFPNYLIIIWNWKTAEKLSAVPSSIDDLRGQSIHVCGTRPLIAQLAKDSGKLLIWQIITTSTIVMSYEQVFLPSDTTPVDVDWSDDCVELAIVDEHGHVYISNKNGSEVNRIVLSQRCGVCLLYETPAVCWFQGGIMLKTTFCQIRFYKRNEGNIWRREKYVKSTLQPYLLSRYPFGVGKLLYFTIEGSCMEMNLSVDEEVLNIEDKFYYGRNYSLVDLVNPWGHHLVAIDDSHQLCIIDAMTGRLISKLELQLENQVTHLVSHLDYPMVAINAMCGELILVAIHEPTSPRIILKFQLQDEALDFIKFSRCGKHLIVGNKSSGICFCIVSTVTNPFSMIYQLETKRKIVDAVFYDELGVLKVSILGLVAGEVHVGHCVFIYELLPSQERFMESANVMQLPSVYQCLHYAPHSTKIVATPYLSRQLHFLDVDDGKQIKLIKCISTQHQVRHLNITTNHRYIITNGYDGLVTVVEDQQSSEASTILLSHHRKDLGVSKAICSPSGLLVIALGRNGSLVCLDLKQKDKVQLQNESERREMVTADYSNLDPTIFAMLSGPCQIIPAGSFKTWVEWDRGQGVLREAKNSSQEKLAIQKSFDTLKGELVAMFNDNEQCSDTEKIPVAAFDLALIARDEKLKAAQLEREAVKGLVQFECSAMDRVTNWIKTVFWNPQAIVSQSILAIIAQDHVTNYPTITEDPQDIQTFRLANVLEDLDKNSKIVINSLSSQYEFIKNRYSHGFDSYLSDDDDSEDEREKEMDQQASKGTTTHRFVDPASQYCQFEAHKFNEFILMNNDIIKDVQQMQEYFNEHFNKMLQAKEHEMALVHELNAKIRAIDSELRLMFDQSVPEILDDPEWHWKERPESIIKVMDIEVKARPYVSASQQELVDKQAAEAERMRLLLMADDFREKTLLRMMDGVLEVRWEDTIKKDIPKPPCLLTKEPGEYNEEDIISLEKYHNDVLNLKQEREMYKSILEDEYSKTRRVLMERIDKFDKSLQGLSVMRMRVESAIQQLNLIRAREFLRAIHRLTNLEEASRIEAKIVNKERAIEKILGLNRVLQELYPSLRKQKEELLAKEKTMIKKFKKEFPSVSKVTLEFLRRQYKKRPKLSLKNVAPGDLLELGECAVLHKVPKYINSHCIKYLAGVHANDIQPASLPESVTPQHWAHLVQVRRRKIELEMTIRAKSFQINEIEQGIAQNKIAIGLAKQSISELSDELLTVRQARANLGTDIEIQLVLKMGQVEMDLHGHRDDTKNAVFLPKSEVERINQVIVEAADEKFMVMAKSINFHNEILYQEWNHQCLKMKMDDLADELNEIKNFFITRDLQVFLRRQSSGLKEDKTPKQLEREIQAMKSNSQNLLRDSLSRLHSIESKIELKKKANAILDKSITRMSVKRWEMELKRDLTTENHLKEINKRKLAFALRRSKLIRQIQREYSELLCLEADYENLKKISTVPFVQVVKLSD